MNHLDLFSGIGGFALAAKWMGWHTIGFVEKDKFCQKVLTKNFGDIPIYDDITTFSGESFRGRVDIITGGFPCQPVSIAGKRKGRDDERFLWREMFRVVQDCQPRWVVAENVRGLVSNESGLVFESVLSDLEMARYTVQPFIVPACAINAPHKRDRVWLVAHANGIGRDNEQEKQIEALRNKKRLVQTSQQSGTIKQRGVGQHDSAIANTDGQQFPKTRLQVGQGERLKVGPDFERSSWNGNWLEVAAALCRVDDGLPRQLDRANRLKALGNAVVPQIPYEIFKAIEETEKSL